MKKLPCTPHLLSKHPYIRVGTDDFQHTIQRVIKCFKSYFPRAEYFLFYKYHLLLAIV